MLYAAPFFIAMAWFSGRAPTARPLTAADWRAVAWLGFLGYYFASLLDFLGLQYITAALERLVLFLNPTIVVVLSALLLKKPITRRAVIALVLSYAGIAFVLLLVAFSLYAPATAAATALLPALYLLYLYEVEIYQDEPWILIGATMVTGAILGFALTTVVGGAAADLRLTGDTGSTLLLEGIVIPLVAQTLMLAGPATLYFARRGYREPLDGLTFGAASALGFSLASELTALWPLISGPLVGSGDPVDWALRLLRLGILVSLVNASTTALITASVWLRRYDRKRSDREREVSLPATLVVAFGVQLLLGLLTIALTGLIALVLVWTIAAIALMLYVRQVIHQALLAEGPAHEIGPDSQCPECHRIVPTMQFCPHCGAARAAAPRSTRIRKAAS